MNRSIFRHFIPVAMFSALLGCSRPETPPPAEAAPAKAENNIVALTPENLTHVTIKTEVVALGSLEMNLKAVGRVSENLNRTAKVTSTLEGRLVHLGPDVNDRVKAGDVLGLVQTPELLGKPLELRAPIDGVITERRSTVGELISKDTEVFTISDPTDLWVLAEIKERDIGAVRPDQEASFTVLAYPDQRFQGRILRIGNRVEAASHTLEVRIAAANPDGKLKPGMFAEVAITTTILPEAVVIPDTALQTLGDERVVFVALTDTKFEKRVVKIGHEEHGRVQIMAGLKPGERVVTEGSFILKSELLKSELGEE